MSGVMQKNTPVPPNRSNAETLRVAVVSDAAPHRNGVGAYYQDLENHIKTRLGAMQIFSPRIVGGKWRGGLAVPLPGDATQKFMVPNPIKLWRQLRSFDPHVVIVPTPGLYGVCGAYLGAKLGCQVIVGFHTWYEKLTELYWDNWQGWWTKGYFDVSNAILFRYATDVVVNSASMIETAERVGARQARLVGTPISYEFLHTPLRPHEGALKRVLFAGRLAAEKNLESILDAAKTLPDISFSIAGDGPERNKVESALPRLENLSYLGWIDRERLMQEIDRHDVLVLPSRVESFGTVALEAMARQRIAVVSKDCGIAEWRDLQAGIVVIEEQETLTSSLQRMMKMDPDKRLQIATRARECAENQNEWNTLQWLEIMQQAPSGDPR